MTRTPPRLAVGVVAALAMLAGCTRANEAADVLRDGACERLRILLSVGADMQNDGTMSSDLRDQVIDIDYELIHDMGLASRELERSSYGDDYVAYWEQVKMGLVSENARDHDDESGPDWHAIAEEGRELARDWGCERSA